MGLQYHLRPHLTKRATCAEKKQHGRRRVGCERGATETTTCSFRGEVSATSTTICEDGSSGIRGERVVSCVKPRRSQTIGSGPRKVRGAQERAFDNFTFLTVSRRERKRSRKGGSHSHATAETLCRRSGQILVCSLLCNSSADLLVGTTSPDHRMRNGANSGKARSGVTWT